MKVLVIGKYPPIEGGVSAQTYWVCRILASRGHQVEVVTDAAEVENLYRIWLRREDLKRLDYAQAEGSGKGYVRVRWSRAWDDRRWHHVPAGNPKVTKLVGMALEVVRNAEIDVIWSYYLEPYAFAASIVSAWTGVPFVLRHAGSDRFRLMRHPDMAVCYREIFAHASVLQSVDADYMGLGVPESHMARSPRRPYVPEIFSPRTAPMDINGALEELGRLGWNSRENKAGLDLGKPIIGMYGKAAASKGITAVLEAVSSERSLRDAQVVLVSGGTGMRAVRECIRGLGMQDRSWLLPFLPHWRIPGFIRMCNVVCALENGFAIPQHSPSIPREIMACGVPLVLSNELAAKDQRIGDVPRPSTFICDPVNIAELAKTLTLALRDDGGEQSAGVDSLQEALAVERGEIADDYERAISKAVSARKPTEAYARSTRGPSSDARRTWLADQVPTIWNFHSSQLGRACDDETSDVRVFLADVVAQALTFAFDQTRPEVPDSQRAIAQVEASLFWMHSDCEGVRGTPVFSIPERALPVDISTNNEITCVPSLTDIYPLASSLILFIRFHRDAVEVLNDRMAEIAAGRGQDIPARLAGGSRDGWLMFAKAPSLEGVIYSVGDKIKQLVEACDGRTPRVDIERSIFDSGTDPQTIDEIWRNLESRGLLEFVWYP